MLVLDPHGATQRAQSQEAQTPHSIAIDPDQWSVHTVAGQPCDVTVGDWSQQAGWELFSGTLVYHASVQLPTVPSVLDLGVVGDIAECRVDGNVVGAAMWAPHHLALPAGDGSRQRIEVHVTNSMANEYEGAQMPSGLLGPVRLLVSPNQGEEPSP